ncbi:MAG: NfuA family Fe-S biogenesis protein [Proteobacteria bacterium]|nr:NfuA family Fe-S biogenesis protein [Pseudomonadota bacterium]MBS0464645.1 NfuA family Fe-S biogenesis protein [Pseudomonadota bacterium]
MIAVVDFELTPAAQRHFARLMQTQGGDAAGIALSAVHPGTPAADARLAFCEDDELHGDEWSLRCEGFALYIDALSAPFFEGARIDYLEGNGGGQLSIRAPNLKGKPPGDDADLAEQVRYVIEAEINPKLASHGGRVTLEAITAERVALVRFGGGCHGCGMADVTLKSGVEKTLMSRLPQLQGVRDATDHETGATPYYKARG